MRAFPDYAALHPGYDRRLHPPGENTGVCLRCGYEFEEDGGDAACSVIARSSCDEAIQTAIAEGFWIASLRSQ